MYFAEECKAFEINFPFTLSYTGVQHWEFFGFQVVIAIDSLVVAESWLFPPSNGHVALFFCIRWYVYWENMIINNLSIEHILKEAKLSFTPSSILKTSQSIKFTNKLWRRLGYNKHGHCHWFYIEIFMAWTFDSSIESWKVSFHLIAHDIICSAIIFPLLKALANLYLFLSRQILKGFTNLTLFGNFTVLTSYYQKLIHGR